MPPTSLEVSPRSASGSLPGIIQIIASGFGLRVYEILCSPFKCGVSIFYRSLVLPKVSPTDSKCSKILSSWYWTQTEEHDVELTPPLSLERTYAIVIILPLVCCLPQEYGSWLYHVFTPSTCVTVVISFRSFLLVFKLFLSTVAL